MAAAKATTILDLTFQRVSKYILQPLIKAS